MDAMPTHVNGEGPKRLVDGEEDLLKRATRVADRLLTDGDVCNFFSSFTSKGASIPHEQDVLLQNRPERNALHGVFWGDDPDAALQRRKKSVRAALLLRFPYSLPSLL